MYRCAPKYIFFLIYIKHFLKHTSSIQTVKGVRKRGARRGSCPPLESEIIKILIFSL